MKAILGDTSSLRSVRRAMLSLVLMVSFLAGSAAAVHAQAPSLFGDAGLTADVATADAGATNSHALRSRLVTANLNLLLTSSGNALDVSTTPQVNLNLFPDTSYTGVITKLTNYDADTHTWSGVLQDVTGGYFYLATSGGKLAGHVASAEGVYEITSAGDNLYKVVQLDESKMVDEPNDGHDMPAGQAPMMADVGTLGDSASRIDVMVMYTSTARVMAGGTSAMNAKIALAMTETNTAYANAGITPRLRLVHAEEVSYAETGVLETDLSHLVNPIDGVMDNVPTLRNRYGADMVSLIVYDGGPYCGLANAIMATANGATAPYDVVALACMTGYYSFGHEFGHLQGARHDMYMDPTLTPFSYGHGYVHPGTTTATRWRTIMAYNDKCRYVYGYDCTRLQYFSNPSKLYGGAPMGDSTRAKNYLVLNATALTVANFRTQRIGDNFSSNFNTSSLGWIPVSGTWSLLSGAYYSSGGLANTGASVKYSSRYGDLTYAVKMRRTGTCTTCANRIIIRGNPAFLDPTKWWKPSYVFQYTNTGLFSVFYTNSLGTTTALAPWSSSAAIVQGGWNTLKVVAVGSTLRFYINGVLVWAGADNALAVGQVGFGFYRDAYAGRLYADGASLTNSPTAADALPADVALGVAVPGGTINKAP